MGLRAEQQLTVILGGQGLKNNPNWDLHWTMAFDHNVVFPTQMNDVPRGNAALY